MRVMLDTNILVSMIIFPSQMFLEMLATITKYHKLVLSSYVLNELSDVVMRKFPKRKEAFKKFLAAIPYVAPGTVYEILKQAGIQKL